MDWVTLRYYGLYRQWLLISTQDRATKSALYVILESSSLLKCSTSAPLGFVGSSLEENSLAVVWLALRGPPSQMSAGEYETVMGVGLGQSAFGQKHFRPLLSR